MFGKRIILQLIVIVFFISTAFGQTPEYAYVVTTEVINSYNNYPITGELDMNSDVGRIEQIKYPATSSTIGNIYFDFVNIPDGFSEIYINVNQNDYMECDYSQPSETILKSNFNYGIIGAGVNMSNCNYVYNLYPLHIVGTDNVDPICPLTRLELTGGYDWEYLIGDKEDELLEWKTYAEKTPRIFPNIGDIYDKEGININELNVSSPKRKIHFRTGHIESGKYVTPITYTVTGCSPLFEEYYNHTKTSCSYNEDGKIGVKLSRNISANEQLIATLFMKGDNGLILVSQYATQRLDGTDKILTLEELGEGKVGFNWPEDIDAGTYYFKYQTLNINATPSKPEDVYDPFWDSLVTTDDFTIEKALNVSFEVKKINDESCFESGDGKIQIFNVKGEEGRTFEYQINNGSWIPFSGNSTIVNNLGKGNYIIKVRDNRGCKAK